MFEIRHFVDSDLGEVLDFWNRNVVADTLRLELLKEKILEDPDFDRGMTLLMEDSDNLVGFMMGVTRASMGDKKRGWVKLFAVDAGRRRQEIASELLTRTETEMKKRGVVCLQIMDTPVNYLQPGIDPIAYTEAICFVERRGFKKFGDTSHLLVELVNQDFDTSRDEVRLAKDDIEVRRACKEDWPDVVRFLKTEWDAWVPEVAHTLDCNPIALHVALLDGRIEACSAYDANNVGTGWFGPMGTSKLFRGKGVGGILLKRCLQDMKGQGHRTSIIPWVGPIPFYMHYCNARVHRVFWRYAKDLS